MKLYLKINCIIGGAPGEPGSEGGAVPGGDIGFGDLGFDGGGGGIQGLQGRGLAEALGLQTDMSDLHSGSMQDALDAVSNMEARGQTATVLDTMSQLFTMVNPFMGRVMDSVGYLNDQAMLAGIPPGNVDVYSGGAGDPNVEAFGGTNPSEGLGFEMYPGDEIASVGDEGNSGVDRTVNLPGDIVPFNRGSGYGELSSLMFPAGTDPGEREGPLPMKLEEGLSPAYSRIYKSFLERNKKEQVMKEIEGMMVPSDMIVDEFST